MHGGASVQQTNCDGTQRLHNEGEHASTYYKHARSKRTGACASWQPRQNVSVSVGTRTTEMQEAPEQLTHKGRFKMMTAGRFQTSACSRIDLPAKVVVTVILSRAARQATLNEKFCPECVSRDMRTHVVHGRPWPFAAQR